MHIKKKFDFHCDDNSTNMPIHYICKYASPGAIKFMLDVYKKGHTMNVHAGRGITPIEHIMKRSDLENTIRMLNVYEKDSLDMSHNKYSSFSKEDEKFKIKSVLECACHNMPMEIINRILNNYNTNKIIIPPELLERLNNYLSHNKHNKNKKIQRDYTLFFIPRGYKLTQT